MIETCLINHHPGSFACHSEPFALCHSEAKPKNHLSQDRLREESHLLRLRRELSRTIASEFPHSVRDPWQ
jgi:hypothetical protein